MQKFTLLSSLCLSWQFYSNPLPGVKAFLTPTRTSTSSTLKSKMTFQRQQMLQHLQMNFFTDIGDMMTGGSVGRENNLPYSPPICGLHSIDEENIRTFAIKERGISFTGEDFDITDGDNNPYANVRGALLHLPGKDKMRIKSVFEGHDEEVCVLDRVLMAVTPTYDIYRGGMNAEKIGWIEKKIVALTDTFDVYMEGKGGFGVTGLFKPPPAYQISGDFIDRNFVVKNASGEIVAKVMKDGLIQFDMFNHYQVQVAPGMDAMFILACACAIDEEFDEEHQKKDQ
mmetsp:Transcript_16006/g.18587  ORF Transcript_16006/g.18587 Transcript_16006/m.18587 type:complete len:284 (-) Transcript_16006:274-1125(-)